MLWKDQLNLTGTVAKQTFNVFYLIRKFMIDAFNMKNTKSTRHLTVDHALLMTHVIELADNLMCTCATPCSESDRDRVRYGSNNIL